MVLLVRKYGWNREWGYMRHFEIWTQGGPRLRVVGIFLMFARPPLTTPVYSSAASDVYMRLETDRVSFLSGMTDAWSHGVYTCILLFVQMNMVPSAIWKLLPRMNQTCGGLQFIF